MKKAINYHELESSLTLNNLMTYDYLNVTGCKDRPNWLYQGISEAKYKDLMSSLKYNIKSTVEETLMYMDVSESNARKIWALTHWEEDCKYPELPKSILCKIQLSQILRGDYDIEYDYPNKPETLYGDSWASKCNIINYMSTRLKHEISDIELAIQQLTIEKDNKLMFKRYLLAEIGLKTKLNAIDALGTINLETPNDFPYSEDQLAVFKSNKRVLHISGGPGTGKSTLAIGIIKQLTNISPKSNVIVIAPTHAAKQRLNKNIEIQQLIKETNNNINEVHTIHSLYYKILNTKNYSFNKSIVVIDEISMIGANLYQFLNTILENTKAHFVVMMGDRNQCKPVKTIGSLPITMHKITNNNYDLTTCHRSVKDIYNAFNHILHNGTILKTFPQVTEISTPYLIRSKGKGEYEVSSILNKVFIEEFFSTFNNPFDTISIQYRNYDTMYFNWLILNELFQRNKISIKSNPLFIDENRKKLNEKWNEIKKTGEWDNRFYFIGMQVIGKDNDGDIKNNIRAIVKNISVDRFKNVILDLEDMDGKRITTDSRHVKPFYASTVHSMQGEESDNIIYVWNDIDTVSLAYTATSRAKNSLKILVPIEGAPHNGLYSLREDYIITSGI